MPPNRAVAILSNSVGSCDDIEYKSAVKTEKMMELPVIRHVKKKPSCLKEVSNMKNSDTIITIHRMIRTMILPLQMKCDKTF